MVREVSKDIQRKRNEEAQMLSAQTDERRRAQAVINQDFSSLKPSVHVESPQAEVVPQVEGKDFGGGHDENLSVPVDQCEGISNDR